VVGDKVYALDTSDKSTLTSSTSWPTSSQVTGEANGDTIAVLSVAAAK
jgi:hypothetical protein